MSDCRCDDPSPFSDGDGREPSCPQHGNPSWLATCDCCGGPANGGPTNEDGVQVCPGCNAALVLPAVGETEQQVTEAGGEGDE